MTTLSEIFVFGNQSDYFWMKIFLLLEHFLDCAEVATEDDQHSSIADDYIDNLSKHVHHRLDLFAQDTFQLDLGKAILMNGQLSPSIRDLATSCIDVIARGELHWSVIHGDLWLGNVLFESRLNQIRIIDPRGCNFDGDETIYGDQRYDLAKLAQSFIGKYDWIVMNRFNLKIESVDDLSVVEFSIDSPESSQTISDLFFDSFLKNSSYKEGVIALMILLFFTMGPLHSEAPTRQNAFLSNGVCLYNRFFGDQS
jgi:hypothetical protein